MNQYETCYKILTWNVLCNHGYQQRILKIADRIKQLSPDIALLQEINQEYIAETVEAFTANGYKIELQHSNNFEHNVGIAYKPEVFQLVDCLNPLKTTFRALSIDLVPVNKLPLKYEEPTYISEGPYHPETPIDYGNDILTVISYHGTWGTFQQPARLNEIRTIDKFAKSKGNAVIMGGDFNALANEPAVQYLKGALIADGESSLWVEAQEVIADLGGQQPHGTSFNHGPLINSNVALFDLNRTPERRIDYLFNFGFSYGREYAFDGWHYDVDIEKARELSDHAPLLAGILDHTN